MKFLNKFFFSINDLITIIIECILNTCFIGKSPSCSTTFSCNFSSPCPQLITPKISVHT